MVCSSRSWSFTMLWRSYRKLLYGGGGNGVQKCIQLSNRCYIRTLHLKRLYFQKQVKEEHQTWNSNCEGSAVSNKCPAHFWPFIHTVQAHPIIPRGGLTGSRTGCNLKTGWCCMIAFLSCLNFALHILMPILRPCLSLPTLVPQGYSALFVSILSGESKELITMMKVRGYSGEKASGMISIRLV